MYNSRIVNAIEKFNATFVANNQEALGYKKQRVARFIATWNSWKSLVWEKREVVLKAQKVEELKTVNISEHQKIKVYVHFVNAIGGDKDSLRELKALFV